MQKIPVTRDGRRGSEIIILNSEDVLKIESLREREFIVHTKEGKYYLHSSLDAFEEWLYEEGFRMIDQCNVVNMHHVTHYDIGRGIVYFGDPDDKKTKKASAARIHREHILNVMEMLRPGGKERQDRDERFKALQLQTRDDRFARSYAMIQAIYEKKRAEQLLADSEQRYRSLFQYNPDAICEFDPQGSFLSVNPATEQITGYPAKELLNRPFHHVLVSREDEAQWQMHFRKTLEGEPQFYETRIQRKDGSVVDLSMINLPIVIDGKISGIYAIGKDITERKRSEELLLKSEKLSVVGQLAAGVAHEIRNPLTSLRGFVQLLQSKIKEYPDYFEIMLSELERINFIVSEFLVIAKPQIVHYQKKDIALILLNTIALINTQAILNNVQITSEFHSDLPLVECDENQLKQVFINILNNSIESMPDGGEIKIEVCCLNNREVRIRCIDQGCGIPENRIPRLGEPFYTTKEKGTGLGLMVSFKIIENHRGRIEIDSELGKGTTVDVFLPVK
jgi:PAS domain S-box-containing protein